MFDGPKGPHFQEELGKLCGLSRQIVSSGLHRLQQIGLIAVEYGQFQVIDSYPMTHEQFFEDYELAQTRTTTGRTITEADIVMHAGQTGDFFPHHMDAAWCATQAFGQRIAHGTLVFSVGIGLTATAINPRAMSPAPASFPAPDKRHA